MCCRIRSNCFTFKPTNQRTAYNDKHNRWYSCAFWDAGISAFNSSLSAFVAICLKIFLKQLIVPHTVNQQSKPGLAVALNKRTRWIPRQRHTYDVIRHAYSLNILFTEDKRISIHTINSVLSVWKTNAKFSFRSHGSIAKQIYKVTYLL